MQGIKNMLLGISIMLAVIVLYFCKSSLTDFMVLISMIVVVKGYCSKDREGESTRQDC